MRVSTQSFPPSSLVIADFESASRTLPALKPEAPWFGYSLGQWPDEFKVEAERAVRSEYWTTGEIIKQPETNTHATVSRRVNR